MNEVTIVMAYYENPGMLRLHLDEWKKYDPIYGHVRFLIVDDGSTDSPALDVVRKHGACRIDLMLFRVLEDRPWGQDAARNIGMHHAQTDWVLLTDMDHMVNTDQIATLMRFEPTRKTYYMPNRVCRGEPKHPHPNSFLFHRRDFWDMGGYDEDFVGFYGSDGNFRKCAKGAGLIEKQMADFYLYEFTTDEIPDANTRKYSRKEGEYYAASNPALEEKRRGTPYRASNPLRLPYERVL